MGREHHNQGQKDGAEGRYNPPVPISPLDEMIWPDDALDEWREMNDDYDKGHSNT